tara:strand:+ start:3109 stop:3582 length:474 start_codon:yes stop_codon:yes gene_type:complete
MTSPLSQFENARILWTAPGVRSSGRDGFKVTEGDAYLITAFLKRRSTPDTLNDRLGLPAVGGMPLEFQGYCLRWSQLTSTQKNAWESIDLEGLAFNTSATLPADLPRDARARLSISGLGVMEVQFSDKDGSYGHEGIGAITRGILGDKLYLEAQQVG